MRKKKKFLLEKLGCAMHAYSTNRLINLQRRSNSNDINRHLHCIRKLDEEM